MKLERRRLHAYNQVRVHQMELKLTHVTSCPAVNLKGRCWIRMVPD